MSCPLHLQVLTTPHKILPVLDTMPNAVYRVLSVMKGVYVFFLLLGQPIGCILGRNRPMDWSLLLLSHHCFRYFTEYLGNRVGDCVLFRWTYPHGLGAVALEDEAVFGWLLWVFKTAGWPLQGPGCWSKNELLVFVVIDISIIYDSVWFDDWCFGGITMKMRCFQYQTCEFLIASVLTSYFELQNIVYHRWSCVFFCIIIFGSRGILWVWHMYVSSIRQWFL